MSDDFAAAMRSHQQGHLLQAAQACFTRNPSGLSYPEVAGRLFVGESWRLLEGEVRAELAERKRRNLYDHPEVEGIDVLDEGAAPRNDGRMGIETGRRWN